MPSLYSNRPPSSTGSRSSHRSVAAEPRERQPVAAAMDPAHQMHMLGLAAPGEGQHPRLRQRKRLPGQEGLDGLAVRPPDRQRLQRRMPAQALERRPMRLHVHTRPTAQPLAGPASRRAHAPACHIGTAGARCTRLEVVLRIPPTARPRASLATRARLRAHVAQLALMSPSANTSSAASRQASPSAYRPTGSSPRSAESLEGLAEILLRHRPAPRVRLPGPHLQHRAKRFRRLGEPRRRGVALARRLGDEHDAEVVLRHRPFRRALRPGLDLERRAIRHLRFREQRGRLRAFGPCGLARERVAEPVLRRGPGKRKRRPGPHLQRPAKRRHRLGKQRRGHGALDPISQVDERQPEVVGQRPVLRMQVSRIEPQRLAVGVLRLGEQPASSAPSVRSARSASVAPRLIGVIAQVGGRGFVELEPADRPPPPRRARRPSPSVRPPSRKAPCRDGTA